MGRWSALGSRWIVAGLLVMVIISLPQTGLVPLPLPTPVAVQGAAAYDDSSDGLMSEHLAKATASPPPAEQLILAELSPKAAELPEGPVTDVPILLYHYIRINPNPHDRI